MMEENTCGERGYVQEAVDSRDNSRRHATAQEMNTELI